MINYLLTNITLSNFIFQSDIHMFDEFERNMYNLKVENKVGCDILFRI